MIIFIGEHGPFNNRFKSKIHRAQFGEYSQWLSGNEKYSYDAWIFMTTKFDENKIPNHGLDAYHWKRFTWMQNSWLFLKIHNFKQIAKFPTASENSPRNIQCGHSIIRQVCWQTHGHADQRLTRGQTSHWPAGHSAKSAPTANCGLSVVVCPPPLVTARNA